MIDESVMIMAKQPENEFLGEKDLIIIGSGPAGSSTALYLQRFAPELLPRSLMLEKRRHPRDKICGGALTINAERILGELDIPINTPFAPVHHVRLVYGNATIDLPEDGCAKRVIRRRDFDNLLFQTAKQRGFPTMEEICVSKVIRRPDHLMVLTNRGHFRAQAVVGADGVGALLRRTAGAGPGRIGRLWLAEIPVDPKTTTVFKEESLLIDLTYIKEGLKGYYWEFPCYIDGKPFISAGIVDKNPKSDSRIGDHHYLMDILTRRGINITKASRKAFPIRYFDPRERFSWPRMILVGDSLGTDPLFSEGISQGMEFGRLAAQAVADGFRRSDLSFFRYSKDVLRSRAGKELTSYARVSRFFYGPHAELLLSMLHENPQLRRLIGCSYAGTQNMHQNTLRFTTVVAKHLLHAKRHVTNFRNAAEAIAEPHVCCGTTEESMP